VLNQLYNSAYMVAHQGFVSQQPFQIVSILVDDRLETDGVES